MFFFKMNTQLLKIVTVILIFNSAFLPSSKAPIVYSEVIPDQTIAFNGTYHLDLNNDGITDFDISKNN